MIKVLINAYACSPDMGSEPGMAWNWCVNLAKYCELYIITEGEFKDNIERVLPTLEHGNKMHFYYLPIGGDDEKKSNKIRKRCWNQGDWRFYIDYSKWQKKALEQAREICERQEIDILHQLNMIGFREPGLLWKIDSIPFIWGPTNAKDALPLSYMEGSSLKNKLFVILKNIITGYQLRTSKKVHNAAKRASYVIAASGDSGKSIKKYLGISPIIINESGCDYNEIEIERQNDSSTFNLLWVGRFIFTKQLSLAIQAIAKLKKENVRLHIVGGSLDEEIPYKRKAKEYGVDNMCIWHEKVSHDDVQKLMRESDLFFFTSISEGTPHVILEAFNNKLPVLCFNTCGQSDCVNENVGIKIPLSNPRQSAIDFAEKISYLYHHHEILDTMSNNCMKRAEELSWDNKAKQIVELYEIVLSGRK